MRSVSRKIAAVAACVALLASSTAALATETVPQAPSAQTPNAWMVLTSLSASQGALGTGYAAAQPADVPPPPPPPPFYRDRSAALPPGAGVVLVFDVWVALIAITLASSNNHNRANSPA